MINRLFLTLTTTTAIAMVQPAIAQEEISNYTSVYYGDRNQIVTIVPIKNEDAAYIKVSGVDHPIENKVFRAETVSAGIEGKDYKIQYEEEERVIFLTRKRYGGEIAELYLPNLGKNTNLIYDRSLSTQTPPLHIQTEYRQQQGNKE